MRERRQASVCGLIGIWCGTAGGYPPALFIGLSGVVRLTLDMLEVFLVQGTDQGVERLEGGAADAVPSRICIDRKEHDGRLAAHGAVLPIEPQRVPGPPADFRTWRHEGILWSTRRPGELRGVGIFLSELCEPFVLTLLLELIAKGGPQFFAVLPTYWTSEVPTRLAAM
ncbi:hypothetical protein ACVMGC_000336 [Bradyrhizobium barranii subsp. barranii]